MSIDEHIKELKKKYNDEFYFKEIDIRYGNWIKNAKTKQEKIILEKIFMNLKFYSKKEMKDLLEEQLVSIKKDYNGLKESVILPLIPNNGRYCGANELISLIRIINFEKKMELEEDFLPYEDTLNTDLRYAEEFESIIIVDDVVGTAGTVEKYLENNDKYFEGKELIFLFILVTDRALIKIEELKKKYSDIKFDIRYCHKVSKISEINVLSEMEYQRLVKIEKRLWGTNSRFILGYEMSELLVLFSHNIPNNTVSNFWYKGQIPWESLFKRFSQPKRKQQNYRNRKRQYNNE
ncbi:hypothetical protein AB5N96_08645 [Chryseomicrobium imtechense]